MMQTGVAVAGPCEGAKLSAPPTWDGKVRTRREGAVGASVVWHQGAYVWQDGTWTWVPSEPTHRCPRCGLHKVRAEYSWSAWSKPGSACRICDAQYQHEMRQRRKQRAASA